MLKQTIKNSLSVFRSATGKHNRTNKEPHLWVLMYHRILPKHDQRFFIEEPGMVVTPATLDMHITEAKKLFELVDLEDWVAKASKGEPLPSKACAITFDDGWLDNYEYAMPILKKHKAPATVFVVSEKMGTAFRFWPNIITELIALKSAALSKHPFFKEAHQLCSESFSTEKTAMCISHLKSHSEDEIFSALESIHWQAELENSGAALMDWGQIKNMTASGSIKIGSHTCTHRRLGKNLPQNTLEFEIVESKSMIERISKEEVNLFCYPNGDYNSEAHSLVRANYQAAVTTQRGINKLTDFDPSQIKRIAIHEDGSNTRHKFRSKLAG